ncbi:MAG: response regulator [Opitutaceae bacterium]|nr:response regulator [Opitutaceae bacterium]
MQDVLAHCLNSLGFLVTCAGTATEAKKQIGAQYFDLVVIDVLMPDGDGLEVIGETKKCYPTARIIAMTGETHPLDAKYCLQIAKAMGVHIAVLKPFTTAEFLKAVQQAMSPRSP